MSGDTLYLWHEFPLIQYLSDKTKTKTFLIKLGNK